MIYNRVERCQGTQIALQVFTMDQTRIEQPQISAHVSVGTKKKLDQLVRAAVCVRRSSLNKPCNIQAWFRSRGNGRNRTFTI